MGQAGHDGASFAPLARPPHVSASIAEQIVAQIVSGALPLGSRLPSETELARTFGVSRPSVREALAALQFVGYVESRRGFGSIVVGNGPAAVDPGRTTAPARPRALNSLGEAVDLLETRLLLEPHALAVAATDPDTTALRAAGVLIDGMRVAVDEPELRASTDIRVHRALLDTCRNAILRDSAAELLDLSLDPLLSTARTQAWSSRPLPLTWAEQHAVVHRAIAAGDPAAARAASLAHLSSVVDNVAAGVGGDDRLARRIARLSGEVSSMTGHATDVPSSAPSHDPPAR